MDGGVDLQRARRIHVIGGMGTGKTVLARRVARVLGAPAYEMDLGVDLRDVVGRPSWVTEGIFLWAIEEALEAADIVVWLDLPYRTCVRRIVIRHAVASLRGKNRHKGLRKLASFALSSRRYWTTTTPRAPTGPTDWGALTRVQTVIVLEPYRRKVVHLRSRRAADEWLAAFAS